MASGWTDRGIARMFGIVFQGATPPTQFYLALTAQGGADPTKDTNTKASLTEVANGNGYTTGGIAIPRSSLGFDVLSEGDPTVLQLVDAVYTASSGSIPISGGGPRYAILTDDNATQSSREVWAFFDLVSERTVSDGQSLTIEDAELQGDLPA